MKKRCIGILTLLSWQVESRFHNSSAMKKHMTAGALILMSVVFLAACKPVTALKMPAPLPAQSSDTISAPENENFLSNDDPVWGDVNAPVAMVVFSDYQCPYCKKLADVLSQVEDDWVKTGKLKIQYRDFPLAMHKNSLSAHVAASAADRQGKYWEYHQRLYSDQEAWVAMKDPSDYLLEIAKGLGLNIDTFVKDYQDPAIIAEITQDRDAGRSTELEGTPAFLINGKLYNGLPPLADLIKYLQEASL